MILGSSLSNVHGLGVTIWAAAVGSGNPGYTMALSPCGVPLKLSRVGIMMPEPLQLQFYLVMLLITRISKGNPYAMRGCSGLGQGCKY